MDAASLYVSGLSTRQVAIALGLNISAARKAILDGGAKMRRVGHLTEEGRAAIQKGGQARKGQKRTPEQCEVIANGRRRWAEESSIGVSVKPSGYVEFTRGPNKGRSAHVVLMEERIGRRLLSDEIVHHVDGDRGNNDINNLALMTRSAHTRLHRREQRISKGRK